MNIAPMVELIETSDAHVGTTTPATITVVATSSATSADQTAATVAPDIASRIDVSVTGRRTSAAVSVAVQSVQAPTATVDRNCPEASTSVLSISSPVVKGAATQNATMSHWATELHVGDFIGDQATGTS